MKRLIAHNAGNVSALHLAHFPRSAAAAAAAAANTDDELHLHHVKP
jgi:hypothetical protein